MNDTRSSKLTIANLRRFVNDPRRRAAVADLLAARVLAVRERLRVDAYVAPILARYRFVSDKHAEHGVEVRPITRAADLYLSADDAGCDRFYAECAGAHEANGWRGPRGHCPALVAEHMVVQAERAVLVLVSEFLGEDFTQVFGDLRERALALFVSDPR